LNDGSGVNDTGCEDSGGILRGSRVRSAGIEGVRMGTVGRRDNCLGDPRGGAGGLLEGPASYPVSGMTGRPVKGLVYGSLPTIYECCGFEKLGLVC
jgi:hypothetical protein